MRSIECQAFRGCGAINIRFLGTKKQWNSIVGLWEEDDGSYVIIGDNVYTASITFSVDIGTFSVDADFTLPHQAYYYTGEPILGEVIVSYGGDVLVEGTDYELQYENNTDIGTATVYVNGIGDYSGTAQLTFKIRLGSTVKVTCKNLADGMKVSWEKVTGAKRYHVYRDNKLIADVSALLVLDREVKLNSGTKYTYKVVAVDSKGVESDVYRTGTYYRLLPTGIKTLTSPSAGKMTVTYDKSPGSSGYVVQFSTKSDMSDAKVISVQGADTLSRTFTNLAKGKTYYVQVRTYKIDNGVRYYSGYCRTKTVTIKK